MTLTAESPSRTIAEELRARIRDGKLKPGDQLPTELELARTYDVARGTVRSALDRLIAEGLVVLHNRRYVVRHRRLLTWLASLPEDGGGPGAAEPQDAWSRSVIAHGRVPTHRIWVERVPADERLADELHLAAGDLLVVRRRLRLVDGRPFQIADSYYPARLVAGSAVESPGDVKPGIYREFRRLGHPWLYTHDRITGRGPTDDEAHALRVPRGGHVLEVARRSFTHDDRPVRLSLFVLPTDRHDIEYRLSEREQP